MSVLNISVEASNGRTPPLATMFLFFNPLFFVDLVQLEYIDKASAFEYNAKRQQKGEVSEKVE